MLYIEKVRKTRSTTKWTSRAKEGLRTGIKTGGSVLYVIMEAKFWVRLQSGTAWKLMDIWQENEKKASRERTVQQVEPMIMQNCTRASHQ